MDERIFSDLGLYKGVHVFGGHDRCPSTESPITVPLKATGHSAKLGERIILMEFSDLRSSVIGQR